MAEIYNAGFFWWKLKQKNVATTAITNKAEIIETWWETNRSSLSTYKKKKQKFGFAKGKELKIIFLLLILGCRCPLNREKKLIIRFYKWMFSLELI